MQKTKRFFDVSIKDVTIKLLFTMENATAAGSSQSKADRIMHTQNKCLIVRQKFKISPCSFFVFFL